MLVEIDTILKPPPPPPLETSYFEEILFTHIFLCALIPVVLVLRLVYSFFFPRQMVIRRPLSPAIVEVEYVVFPRHVNVFHGPHQMISTE